MFCVFWQTVGLHWTCSIIHVLCPCQGLEHKNHDILLFKIAWYCSLFIWSCLLMRDWNFEHAICHVQMVDIDICPWDLICQHWIVDVMVTMHAYIGHVQSYMCYKLLCPCQGLEHKNHNILLFKIGWYYNLFIWSRNMPQCAKCNYWFIPLNQLATDEILNLTTPPEHKQLCRAQAAMREP